MTKNILFLLIILTLLKLDLHSESFEINLNKGLTHDVWFDFENGVTQSSPNDEWDIAFQSNANAGIRINGQKGMDMWVVPNSDVDSWDGELDTTGMSQNWETHINSLDNWNVGAFNLGIDGFISNGDFGWGSYSIQTHFVMGSKVFVIKLANGDFKKFFIESLAGGIYEFKWGDIDGSNEVTATVSKQGNSNLSYIYFSLEENKIVDRAPILDNWDILFGKYISLVQTQNGAFWRYPVSGARTSPVIQTAKIEGIDPVTEPMPEMSSGLYQSSITTIGSDWKDLKEDFTYEIPNDVVYFLTKRSEDFPEAPIYRLYFTDYEGSSTGIIKFEFGDAVTSVIESGNKIEGKFSVYPNIIEKGQDINLAIDLLNNSRIKLNIVDMLGNKVYNNEITNNGSFDVHTIDNLNLSSGMYMLFLEINGTVGSEKIIVK